MKAGKIKIGDTNINYYESPAPGSSLNLERQTVFFLHGNSSSATTFRPQFESELSKKYRLVAIDLPGHGDSEWAKDPENSYSVKAMASTIVAAAETLKANDAIFIAWSMTGHLLLEAAESLPNAKAFCIYGTPPIGIPPAMGEAFFPAPVLEYAFNEDLTTDQIEEWADYALKPGSDLNRELITDAMGKADGRVRRVIGNSVISAAYTDELETLKNLACPLAIFHGKEERLVKIEYLENLDAPTLWRKEVQIIPNAGHSPHIEQAGRFNRLLEEFIEDVK